MSGGLAGSGLVTALDLLDHRRGFRTVTFRNMTHPVFVDETTPTARALLVLEMVQNSPGIRGEQLADRLGMTDRAVRRYVGNLRDAGIPVESTRGKYGGYRIGRGVRLAPLMFTAPEALGAGDGGARGPRARPDGPRRPGGRQDHPRPPAAGRRAGRGRRTDERADPRRPLLRTRPAGDRRGGAGLRRRGAGCGSPTGSGPTRSATWTSTHGRSWCGSASGTCWAGRTPWTRGGSCGSTVWPRSTARGDVR